MKFLVPYFLGVMTPFLAFFAFCFVAWFSDRRDRQRYIRAWHKFTAEWDAKNIPGQTAFVRKVGGNFHGRTFLEPRDLYFAHRWNNGQTKEV